MFGQGLNTGVQDAVNLGWKLAQVVNETSPESLLDTYHAERHPVGARVLHNTMAQVALSTADDRHQALRETMAELLKMDEPRRRFAGMLSGLDIHYDLGEVAAPAAVLIRPDGHVAWSGDLTDPELPRALAFWFGAATPARSNPTSERRRAYASVPTGTQNDAQINPVPSPRDAQRSALVPLVHGYALKCWCLALVSPSTKGLRSGSGRTGSDTPVRCTKVPSFCSAPIDGSRHLEVAPRNGLPRRRRADMR